MPEISRFFGIIIAMFYGDHAPPHFHVRYGEQRAIIEIDSLDVLRGWLSLRVLGIVTKWAAAHKVELRDNWRLAQQRAPLRRVAPLE